jgi:hydrogenase nickel incorporation protein HypB
MCDTCGCNSGHSEFKIYGAHDEKARGNGLNHSHEGQHHPSSDDQNANQKIIHLETDILANNKLLAKRNRGYFEAKNIKVFNLVSSPGSGKTMLLEKLIVQLKSSKKIFVIEGDQQTSLDAQRIEATGAKTIQINTGNGCHLDAHMINHALKELNPGENSILFIENVGNLVCPALFDLGERTRIIIISVTEGEDKPLKYPSIFQSSQLCILNKTDLLPYVEFETGAFLSNLQKIKTDLPVKQVSAKTGKGLEDLIEYFLKD